MGSQLFGPLNDNSDIRVGYIDPDNGFVDGLSVCEANEYARLNPGTIFIFKSGDKILKYLNINDVNALTTNDVVRTVDECGGVNQKIQCGPPKIDIKGGGGVGAVGNPIIGTDGSILAVDIIKTGHGYSFPPQVTARDECDYGSGTVLRAVLGELIISGDELVIESEGSVSYGLNFRNLGSIRGYRGEGETYFYQYYDRIDDYEEYFVCDTTEIPYGTLWGPNGENLGEWTPTVYIGGTDPILGEIQQFQEIVRQLEGGFFNTRKIKPSKITSSEPKTTGGWYHVTDETFRELQYKNGVPRDADIGWGDFQNKYAISPKPPSNVKGSDFAGILFTYEWNLDFPTTGDYIFRGTKDNSAKLYIDNVFISDLDHFKGPAKEIKKFYESGRHTVRLELINAGAIVSNEIFNTIDWIGKADRKLWRTNIYDRGGFLNQYGVCPFDTTTQLEDNPYAGVHVIRWQHIDFPADGEYTIEVEVDDDVKLFIGNREGGGAVEIGNGLTSIENGGDEVIIEKKGFKPNSDKGTGKSTYTRFFKKGKYRIRAELTQIPGGRFGFSGLKGTNPMALAVRITSSKSVSNIISSKSWNDNPMGVALTIDAPEPTVPQEPPAVQEGRCPPNPIWTTRSSGSKDQWYPVTFPVWSKFTNRYAISPVKPLAQPNTDKGGIVFSNSWTIEIPFDGYYGLKSTVDNAGKISIDGEVIMQSNYIPRYLRNSKGGSGPLGISGIEGVGDAVMYNFRENNPKAKKLFLTKGTHTIDIEVENGETITYNTIDQQIFNTKNWSSNPQPKVTEVVQQTQTQTEEWVKVDDAFVAPTAGRAGLRIPDNASFHKFSEGTYYKGKRIRSGGDWNDTNPNTNYIEWDKDTRLTLGSYHPGVGQRFGISVWKKKVVTSQQTTTTQIASAVSTNVTKNGVTYNGPELFAYKDKRWGEFLNKNGVSPYLPPLDSDNSNIIGPKNYVWTNVDFPFDGQYTIKFQGDDTGTLFINDQSVATIRNSGGTPSPTFVNLSRGKYTVRVELNNIKGVNDIFLENPAGFALEITKKVDVPGPSKPWSENPVGISAALIAPPCPRRIDGRGIVTDVIVEEPGNGYLGPIDGPQGYPVLLKLKEVLVKDPGINYNCGVDQIQITPDLGCDLSYSCDAFGRITEVKVNGGCSGFTEYPTIRIISDTGVNFEAVPLFEVIRDPLDADVDPDQLIQVTDLVGLKQTGYVDGRAYYGAVFYKEGVRYAGYFETAGQLIQVYDTLQESITAQVTTTPSAIQRQGTDTKSNNPRLNLPGTPDNLI